MTAAHHLTTFSPASSITTNSTIASLLLLAFPRPALSATQRQASMVPSIAKLTVFLAGASLVACHARSPRRRPWRSARASPQQRLILARIWNWRRTWLGVLALAMSKPCLLILRMLARKPMAAAHHLTTFSPASSITTNSMIASLLLLAFPRPALSATQRQANMAPSIAKLTVFLAGASLVACHARSPRRRPWRSARASPQQRLTLAKISQFEMKGKALLWIAFEVEVETMTDGCKGPFHFHPCCSLSAFGGDDCVRCVD